MANVINATSTGSGGLISTGDDSGILNIQTNETTALSIDASQIVSFTNAVTAPNISPPVRQTVLYAATDSSGYNALISAGSGLNFNVDATPTSAVLAFANGTADVVTTLTADASNQGTLAASNTNYLTATYSSPSAVTWGSYLVPPQYGYAFDRTQNALLNFEGSNGATTTTDDFGNTWTAAGNAQIDTAQYKFGTSSLLLDGTGDYISSSSFTSFGDGSFEISCWFRINALPTAGNRATFVGAFNASNYGLFLGLYNNAGTTKLEFYASSTGSSSDIANGTVGTNTTWTLNQWNKFRLVFDALGGTYRVYLSLNAAAETQDISVSSTARLCSITTVRVGENAAGGAAFNGWIDAFRILRCATNTSTETPSASAPTITDYPVHFFSIPAMTMYYASSASSTAGTNPTLTQTTRLFVGEADTGASTVSAVRNYALKGQYTIDTAALASATFYSVNHNIGVRPGVLIEKLVCLTQEAGYYPGDEAVSFPAYFDGTNSRGHGGRMTSTSYKWNSGSAALTVMSATTAGNIEIITMSKWKARFFMSRGW